MTQSGPESGTLELCVDKHVTHVIRKLGHETLDIDIVKQGGLVAAGRIVVALIL
jgi:hypothetical protein